MSEENVEIVRRLHDAFRSGDPQSWLNTYREDAEIDMSRMPGGGTSRGPEGAREFYAGWIGAWEEFESEAVELIDAGDAVVLIERIRGIGKGSGAEVTMRAADVVTFEDGRIVRHVGYPDAAEALAELGLSDPGSR